MAAPLCFLSLDLEACGTYGRWIPLALVFPEFLGISVYVSTATS